jgi:signal transduction histidine kinase
MSHASDQGKARADDAMPGSAAFPAAQRRGTPLAGYPAFRVAPANELDELARAAGEGRFAAYVAHELRSPLATQRALLELTLTDPFADAASWRDVAEDVLDACMEQERLLEACLALARSRCGLRRHDRIDLAAIAAEALRAGDLNGLESVVSLEPARTTGDPSLVERLAANLVSNAIRHNVIGGRIEVETRAESGRAVLMVANTGPLVPAADLHRLFQPFQRLNSNPRNFSDGVGLGLAIVEAIADVHDAIVTATARVGGGLEIDVSFPRPLKERRPRTQRASGTAPTEATAGLKR